MRNDDRTKARFRLGEWEVDPRAGLLIRNGMHTRINPRSMRLLVRLAERPGQLVSVAELRGAGSEIALSANALHKCVLELRRAFGRPGLGTPTICTVHGRGYLLLDSVSGVAARGDVPLFVARFDSCDVEPARADALVDGLIAELARDERLRVVAAAPDPDQSGGFAIEGRVGRSDRQLDLRLRLTARLDGRCHFVAYVRAPEGNLIAALASIAAEIGALLGGAEVVGERSHHRQTRDVALSCVARGD